MSIDITFCCSTTDLSSESIGIEGNVSDTDEVGLGNITSNAARAVSPIPTIDFMNLLLIKLHIKMTYD
jgi:hypothetical protein